MKIFRKFFKKFKKIAIVQFVYRNLFYLFVRTLFATYRLKVSYTDPTLQRPVNELKGVFYFWHQNIISGMFFFFKSRATGACIVSPSNDGQLAGFVCQKLGFTVLFGSSHKASISVLRQSIAQLKITKRLCLVGDGSRGPAFQLQPGVSYLAEKAGVPLVFVDCKPSRAITLKKSWDQFKIPLPFSTISVIVCPQKLCGPFPPTPSL